MYRRGEVGMLGSNREPKMSCGIDAASPGMRRDRDRLIELHIKSFLVAATAASLVARRSHSGRTWVAHGSLMGRSLKTGLCAFREFDQVGHF